MVAHELGHSMSLYDAPCGTGSVLDRAYPYAHGTIETWGIDSRSGHNVLLPPTWSDLMSYCVPAWVSEYNLYRPMNHRLNREASADRSAVSGPALLVWGGTDNEGVPYLNPAFAIEAPPARGGGYRLVGRAIGGELLFCLSFDMRPRPTGWDGADSRSPYPPSRSGPPPSPKSSWPAPAGLPPSMMPRCYRPGEIAGTWPSKMAGFG